MNIDQDEVIATSLIKAVIYAVVLPLVIATVGSIAFGGTEAFYALVTWYTVFAVGYKYSTTKQLTAFYFFNVLKWFIAPLAAGYIGLIIFSYFVASVL